MECLENSEYAEIWGQYFMNYSIEFIWADQYQALGLFYVYFLSLLRLKFLKTVLGSQQNWMKCIEISHKLSAPIHV